MIGLEWTPGAAGNLVALIVGGFIMVLAAMVLAALPGYMSHQRKRAQEQVDAIELCGRRLTDISDKLDEMHADQNQQADTLRKTAVQATRTLAGVVPKGPGKTSA